jgi:hypothetical protein
MRVQLDMSSDNQTNIAPDALYSMPDAQVPISEDPSEMDELADNRAIQSWTYFATYLVTYWYWLGNGNK